MIHGELRRRTRHEMPARLDPTEPIATELLNTLGMDRAVHAIAGVLTAITGPPGAAAATDNLDIGRREEMALILGRRVRTPPPGGYRTRLLSSGDEVTLNAYFGHSRVKSSLQCGRAFRIETVVKRAARPTVQDGRSAPALRFGDP